MRIRRYQPGRAFQARMEARAGRGVRLYSGLHVVAAHRVARHVSRRADPGSEPVERQVNEPFQTIVHANSAARPVRIRAAHHSSREVSNAT